MWWSLLPVRVADYPSRCRLREGCVCDRFYSPSRSVADITRMEQFCQRSPVGHQQHPCLTDNSLAATHTRTQTDRQTQTCPQRADSRANQPTNLCQPTGGSVTFLNYYLSALVTPVLSRIRANMQAPVGQSRVSES